LFGKALSTEISRDEAERLILEGFFPACNAGDKPHRAARVALQELGLPYAQDPAVTRQLSGFLSQHASSGFAALGVPNAANHLPRPDAVLLNGGVFNSPRIAARLLEVISAWWPVLPDIRLLPHSSLELSVARGAACYGMARKELGRRIGGGTAHALYVGLAPDKNNPKSSAVCLIPRGHEEGQSVDLSAQPFSLILGRPVQFPLFSTASDFQNQPGEVVEIGPDFQALPPIHTLLKGQSDRITTIPVHLRGTLTELGTLELWCVSNATDERWRLEFELRSATTRKTVTFTESSASRGFFVLAEIERIFGAKSSSAQPRDVKQLFRNLEKNLGPRETWRLPLLRELWSVLYAGAGRRRRSADHERVFFQLLGYSLRPGFGYPLDEWRCEQTFKLFAESIKFHAEHPVWNEFWIMWRRIAGGLDETHQNELWNFLKPHLARRIPPALPKNTVKLKGVQPEGIDQMLRTAASLEHLNPSEKAVLGYWVVERLKDPNAASGPWAWVLGRLGTRVPIYGSGHKTTATEQAQAWAELLLNLGLQKIEGAPFALVQLARMTGDRTRDLEDELRARIVDALKMAKAPDRWLSMVTEALNLDTEEEAQALGDSLPVGLNLR